MTFGCGPSCLLGCSSADLVIPLALVVPCLWWACVQSVCAWYVTPTDGHGSEMGRNGTAVESENMKVGAEVRGSAPGTAHEGLLLWALQSAAAASVCHLSLNFRPWETGRGKRQWGGAGPFHVWRTARVPVTMTEAKAGFSNQQFYLESHYALIKLKSVAILSIDTLGKRAESWLIMRVPRSETCVWTSAAYTLHLWVPFNSLSK